MRFHLHLAYASSGAVSGAALALLGVPPSFILPAAAVVMVWAVLSGSTPVREDSGC